MTNDSCYRKKDQFLLGIWNLTTYAAVDSSIPMHIQVALRGLSGLKQANKEHMNLGGKSERDGCEIKEGRMRVI